MLWDADVDLGVLTIKPKKAAGNPSWSMICSISEYHKLKGNLLWLPDSKNTRRPKERMLKATMGKPTVQQASLERFIMSLDEDARWDGLAMGHSAWDVFWYPKKGNFIAKNGDLMRIQAMKSFDELSAASYGCFNSRLVDVDGVFVEQPKQQVSWWIRVDFWSKTDNVVPVQLERLGLGTHPKKG